MDAHDMTRRRALALAAGFAAAPLGLAQELGRREAPFTRDYPEPDFKPKWRNAQLNSTLVQDFVIYAHSDLERTKSLLEREPRLANAFVDWGGGDWESALGAASHVGRHDIVRHMLANGARIDIFAATVLGQLEVVKALLALEPKLIDARGPHGFNLHHHAQRAEKDAAKMVDFLQSVKKIELGPPPPQKKDSGAGS